MFKILRNSMVPLLAFFCLATISSCNDPQRYMEKLNLSKEQTEKVKPIIDEYLSKQDEIFKLIVSDALADNQTIDSETIAKDNERKMLLYNAKFEVNDDHAAEKLSSVLTEEQIELFRKAAVEIRQEQIKEKTKPRAKQ
jgi:hypothetical protein